MKKKQEVKPEHVNLVKLVSFMFLYEENATNVTMALAKSGYFVNIINTSSGYEVSIYTRAAH
jgi:hypothetical protein